MSEPRRGERVDRVSADAHSCSAATSSAVGQTAAAKRGPFWRVAWAVAEQTYNKWAADNAARLAAALAYYTIFSLAPLLVLAIGVAGLFLGREAVRGELVAQIAGLVGRDGATAIEDLIAHAGQAGESLLASTIGFLVLLYGASNVVGELKASLNTVWGVPPSDSAWFSLIRERLMSFALVLGIGFVLLVSLIISAGLAAASRYLHGDVAAGLWLGVNFAVTLGIEALLFSLMFKVLPDTEVRWSDVWVGALATALMFELGKLLVGLYLGRAGLASAFGAAGSLVVVLVWVYYSAQILFFGAELTQVLSRRHDAVEEESSSRSRPEQRPLLSGDAAAQPR